MSATRKRSRAAALTPTTALSAPPPPALRKFTLAGGTALPSRQIEMWTQGKFCDATITVEGRQFDAHRMALVSGSDYFHGAFTSGFAEGGTAHVSLPDLKASAFEAVLSFVYTGECEVWEEDLPTLLQCASYLQAKALLVAACDAVKVRLVPENILSYWSLADAHSMDELACVAKEEALRHFEAVVAASEAEFAALPHERLLTLLSDERLTTTKEEAVHTAVIKWSNAQQPPVDDESLLALLSTVRYRLVSRDFFEGRVLTEPRLQGGLGLKVLFGAAAGFSQAVFGGTLVGRRLGFLPHRLPLKWCPVQKGGDIALAQTGTVATATGCCHSIRTATPLPASGKHLVELLWETQGSLLGEANMVGVASGSVDISGACALARAASSFWGVDSSGYCEESILTGIRRGKGGQSKAPEEALTGASRLHGRPIGVFVAGDRIGLLVDMDAHTLTMLRNGTPIPSLVFDNLPHEDLYVAVTVFRTGNSVRILHDNVDA